MTDTDLKEMTQEQKNILILINRHMGKNICKTVKLAFIKANKYDKIIKKCKSTF